MVSRFFQFLNIVAILDLDTPSNDLENARTREKSILDRIFSPRFFKRAKEKINDVTAEHRPECFKFHRLTGFHARKHRSVVLRPNTL